MAPHEAELIGTLAVGLAAALLGGLVAHRLRLPAVVGYLLAGVVVGPFTPGFVADARLAPQLAEVGVILLMFGVGLHISLTDLLAVRRIAVPGALAGIAVTTLLAFGLTRLWGWSAASGVVFGLALSVASTVVVLRTLAARGLLRSHAGRVAVGWLVVEDVSMVVVLVLLPTLVGALGGSAAAGSETPNLPLTLATTIGKEAAFIALMVVAGARFIPWLLRRVERTGSRELFVLATLATALFIAYGATQWFGVSSAIGAFLAGIVINESDLSARAAAEALPLREVFAVLFFVSVGMAIDPHFLANEIGRVAAVTAVIVVGKSIAVCFVGRPLADGRGRLTLAAALAQIGEFSFILAAAGSSLGLLTAEAVNLILAGSLCSITINPALFRLVEPVASWFDQRRPAPLGASIDRNG
ncbi:MAG TPA: cation:proton antiporter [Thermomicrobiales bacterium]|nr:cation:proton antiporter [Thermomicrobiales bacterium]